MVWSTVSLIYMLQRTTFFQLCKIDWLNWLISFIYCVWPGAPEAKLRRDLSEDKGGTNTAAVSGSPASQLHRRRHQDSWLGWTQMQRISTRTCQIHGDGLSQRDSEISSECWGTSKRRHDSFLPPILRASALLPGPKGNKNFVRAAQKDRKKSLSYLTVSVSAHTDSLSLESGPTDKSTCA